MTTPPAAADDFDARLQARARALARELLDEVERCERERCSASFIACSDAALGGQIVLAILRCVFSAAAQARGIARPGLLSSGRLFAMPCAVLELTPGCDGLVSGPNVPHTGGAGGALAELVSLVRGDPGVASGAREPEFLGRLYEALISARVGRANPAAPRSWVAAAARKHSGSFFTPPALTEVVVEQALATLEWSGAQGERVRELRVCDPAVGGAAFLIQTARALLARSSHAGANAADLQRWRVVLVRRVLHGVDVSPLAVAVAEASLWLFAGDPELELACAGENLRVGDALVGEPERQGVLRATLEPDAGALDWPREFPDVFARGGFDLVVGNPPWVAYAGRAAKPLHPGRRAYFAQNYSALRGYPTLHALFVERALKLAPRGSVALVLPSPIADLDGYRAVRRLVRLSHRVREPLLEFGQDAFDAVTQPCFALIAEAGVDLAASAPDAPFRLSERQRAHARAEEIEVPDELIALFDSPSFPARLFGEMGFQTTRAVTATLLCRTPAPQGRHTYPLLEGRDVHEFSQGPPRLFLAPDREQLDAARCRLRPESDFLRVRFVVRQTARFPIACRHGGLPFRNSLLAGFELPELEADLVVGLLNSTLYRALHVARRRDARQAAFPQVKVGHLRALPMPPEHGSARRAVAALSARAHGHGVDAELRRNLDDAVFELFSIAAPGRERIVAFLRRRTPQGARTTSSALPAWGVPQSAAR